jgi:hypothetical protein
VYLSLDPRVAGSNPAEARDFFMAIKFAAHLPSGRKQSRRPDAVRF